MDIIMLIIILGLIMRGVISFTLFISRILINTTPRSSHTSSESILKKTRENLDMKSMGAFTKKREMKDIVIYVVNGVELLT